MSESESFEDLLKTEEANQPAARAQPKIGETVSGTLVAVGEEHAFVDLGGKTEGRMDVATLKNAEGELTAQIGDTVSAAVTGRDSETGTLLLGPQHGQKMHGLEEIQRAFAEGLPVQGQVTATVKGGLEVQVAGLRAFCPASQADIRFVEDLGVLVGQRFDFRVTKIEGGKRPNLVVSRRALLEEEQRVLAEQVRAQLKEGAVLTGTVTSIKDYGAFVDLGGIEGMIHISEMAFGHVKHPNEVLTLGQTVEVAVLRIEPAREGGGGPRGRPREKIALSIRALARDPWADVEERFAPGTRVEGTVSRIQPFGAFVELAPGIDGLIHISELGAGRRLNDPSEVLSVGERVEARVLTVDLGRRRIGLSLDPNRDASRDPARDAGRDASKDAGREIGRPAARVAKTGFVEDAGALGPDFGQEPVPDSPDAGRDGGRDWDRGGERGGGGRGRGRDFAPDNFRDGPRGGRAERGRKDGRRGGGRSGDDDPRSRQWDDGDDGNSGVGSFGEILRESLKKGR